MSDSVSLVKSPNSLVNIHVFKLLSKYICLYERPRMLSTRSYKLLFAVV